MLNRFYVKYSLFIILVLMAVFIIQKSKNTVMLPVLLKEDKDFSDILKYEEECTVYVFDKNKFVFPLHATVKYGSSFNFGFYKEKIISEMDKKIYLLFSLLTNYNNYLPMGVYTYIPQASRLIDYSIDDGLLTLNVSDNFLRYNKGCKDEILKTLVFSYTAIPGINKVKIVCENNNVFNEVFARDDFILNLCVKNADIYNLSPYEIYYYTKVNNDYYLVSVTVFDINDKKHQQKVLELLTYTSGLPLISFYGKNTDEKKEAYQYYLTCFANNIGESNQNVNVNDINGCVIEFNSVE